MSHLLHPYSELESAHDHQALQKVFHMIGSSLDPLCKQTYKDMKQAVPESTITELQVRSYIISFFQTNRDDKYRKSTSAWFQLLLIEGFSLNEILRVVNSLYFNNMKMIMDKNRWLSRKTKLLDSLQRAVEMELDIVATAHMDYMLVSASKGIMSLIGKNSEIIGIRELLARMDEQQALSQNVACTAQELAASIEEVARNTTIVAEQADGAVQQMDRGKQVIADALGEIAHSDHTFDTIIEQFDELKAGLEKIDQVAALVEQIASQTQLLALNASIEAARAGKEGNGFAVVASEIRKLANSTTASLQEVHDQTAMISKLSTDVSDTIYSVSRELKKGVLEADQALDHLSAFGDVMRQMSEATTSIAVITEQQAASVESTSTQVVSLAQVSEHVSELAHETGTAVYELSQLTEQFRNELFKQTKGLPVEALLQLTKSDHMLWKWRIYNMLLGYERVEPEQVTSHRNCRLGKWYYSSDTVSLWGKNRAYELLDKPHKLVHEHAHAAAQAYASGDIQQAELHLKQLEAASGQVVSAIDSLLEEIEK